MAVREVAKGVSRIPLAWSNVYVLTDGDDVMLIDAGLKKDLPALLAGLESLGIAPAQVRRIVLTHAHTDHAGCAAWFADNAGTRIIVHSAEAPYLRLPRQTYVPRGWGKLRHPITSFLFAAGEILYPVPRCREVETVEDGDSIDAPGGTLRVVATPGHSPGHLSLWRESDRVLFAGDAVLTIVPILLRDDFSLPLRVFSTDWTQTKRSVCLAADLEPEILLSGHGKPLTENTAEQLRRWAAQFRDKR